MGKIMKTFRRWWIGALALACATALCVGFASCGNDGDSGSETSKNSSTSSPSETVSVAGGYQYKPADQPYGLDLNLYENGTFYFSQFTSKLSYGKYISAAAAGQDSSGRTILYTVTFTENDVFAKEGETPVHNIVRDTDGDVYLTAVFDSMSQASYDFKKQETLLEEVVQTVAVYWSDDYENDFVKVELKSDDSYALDGINGAGQAGSLGTYVSATAESGAVTYTLTDGDDKTKTYTLTVGADIKLSVGNKTYTMTDLDPEAIVEYVFSGKNVWTADVVLTCYSNSECKVQITLAGTMDFTDAKGTWQAPTAGNDYFVFVLGAATVTAEKNDDGSYVLSYTVNAADFQSEQVTLTYTPETVVTTVLTLSVEEESWGFSSTAVLKSDNSFEISTVMGTYGTFTAKGTYVENQDGTYTLTFTEDAGVAANVGTTAAVTKNDGMYSLMYTTSAGAKTLTGTKAA